MSEEELYTLALSDIHKYNLLNEIFAIRDKRFLKEQQEEIERLNNIIKKLEEFIEREIELYTVELTEENERKLSIVAPIKGVYKEIYNVLQKLKSGDE